MAGNLANAMRAGFMGFPVWGTDVGGYLGDGHIDERLYARWLQWGAWNGMFEVKLDGAGGQGEDRVPWRHSERLQSVFRQAAEQRMALLPYSYSLANTSGTHGVLMKPMAYVYPQDENTHDLWDQYLFGDAFLVAPMLTPDDRRPVYLPEGRWYDFHDKARVFEGGQTIEYQTGWDHIPVFVSANSLYMTGDIYRGSAERWHGPLDKQQARLTLHVFPGEEGESTEFTYVDYYHGNQKKRIGLTHRDGEIRLEAPTLTVPTQVSVRLQQAVKAVKLNGLSVPGVYDADARTLSLYVPPNQPVRLRLSL